MKLETKNPATTISAIRNRTDDIGHRFYAEMIGSLLQTMIYDLFDSHTRSNDNSLTTDRVGYITSLFFAMTEGADRRHIGNSRTMPVN